MTPIKSWQKAFYELKVTYANLVKDLHRVENELQESALTDSQEDFEENVRNALHHEMSTIADLAYYFRQLAESVTFDDCEVVESDSEEE